jgi:hypothetical protein
MRKIPPPPTVFVFLVSSLLLAADGATDNVPEKVRPVPPPGIELSPAEREGLEKMLSVLSASLERLRMDKSPAIAANLPDVEIYFKAVSDALTYGELFKKDEVDKARALLEEGEKRAGHLAKGTAPWTAAAGLVARGFVSRMDGSVQPYGLVVPESYSSSGGNRYRLDLWFHGRGETLSELNFLDQRQKDRGLFTPPDTFVLHPYGRYCNAFKLAGEVDVLEALESVRSRYRIDEDRIAVRGFSMGGAGAWHFAVHYSDRWFAANPGAGFAETPDFLKVFQKEGLQPAWYERKLWHLYDSTDWAGNLFHCPTVAYSGELDIQKQAADVMSEALRKEGMELFHVIGSKTQHQYHPESKIAVDRSLDEIAKRGRERAPRTVHFTTYTLKYNQIHWVTIDSLGEHWQRARIDAQIAGDHAVTVQSENVEALTLSFPPGWCPLDARQPVLLVLDGAEVEGPRPWSDRSWLCRLHRVNGKWQLGPQAGPALRKRHDLQGPIDDAFLDSFLLVRPTGKSRYPAVEKWARGELDHAVERWRRQFRGHARVKDDAAISDEDLRASHLVLWGDPESNAILGRIKARLPIQWNAESITVGNLHFAADHHALVAIYPNPLNPDRYVVLNSSFTYREYDDLNNARQVPKLPDWAVVDLETPPDSRYPGKVTAAGFFGEAWELRLP